MDLTKLICWRSAHYATVQSLYKNDTMGVSKNLGGYINTNWGNCQANGQDCVFDYILPQNTSAHARTRGCYQGSVTFSNH